VYLEFFFFFFSSRRRHTRFSRDWSSDVCSSDLLENPDDAITGSCRKIRATIDQDDYEPGRAWIWHRPGGFDLRSRALRAEFEANLALVRPDLVCLGPLYKAYQRKANEQDEQASAEVQATLDDLRTRYGFALLLEHHAPQAQ